MKREICPYCRQPIMQHRHSLNDGLANILLKVAQKFDMLQPFHLQRDLELTKNEYANFQKLKYWDLVEKVTENGRRKGGYWRLTVYVGAFLRGERSEPCWVTTFNNKVVEQSQERVYFKDIAGEYELPEMWARRARPVKLSEEKQMAFI